MYLGANPVTEGRLTLDGETSPPSLYQQQLSSFNSLPKKTYT